MIEKSQSIPIKITKTGSFLFVIAVWIFPQKLTPMYLIKNQFIDNVAKNQNLSAYNNTDVNGNNNFFLGIPIWESSDRQIS